MIALSTDREPSDSGLLRAEVVDRIGVEDVTILAVRPDGYIGHLSDGTDLRKIGEYLELIRAGAPRTYG